MHPEIYLVTHNYLSVPLIFVGMILSIALGYRVGKFLKATSGLAVTEGAVFTLMALLVAFTFASANQRYDERRMTIVDEANAISTAYLRIDLLPANDQLSVKKDFLAYVNARLAIYEALPDMENINKQMTIAANLQEKLWVDATASLQKQNNPMYAAMLLLPAMNTMFDIANSRTAAAYLHLSTLVLSLLIIVSFLSAFLTGYGMAGKGEWYSLHVLTFAIITTLTIYTIIDLEYPRAGIINEKEFDAFLIDVRDQITQTISSVEHAKPPA